MTPLRYRLAFLLALVLCAGNRSAAAEDAPLDIAMGAKVFAEQCWRCHEPPDPAGRDGRAWRTVSLHMRVFAGLTRAEQLQLAAFLRYQSAMPASDANPPQTTGK